MSFRLAKVGLVLYPLAYRRRYGEEMRILIEDTRPDFRAALDLLRGAIGAHLHPQSFVAAEVGPEDRFHVSVRAILTCWVVFAVAAIGFYKVTRGGAFTNAGNLHPGLDGSLFALNSSVAVAVGVVMSVAIALTFVAIQGVRREQRTGGKARLLGGAIAAFATATVIGLEVGPYGIVQIEVGGIGTTASNVLWSMLAFLVFVGPRGLLKVDSTKYFLYVALVFGLIATVAMGFVAVATAVYLGTLIASAPVLAAQDSGVFGFSAGVLITIQLAVMIAAACAAAVTAKRGWMASDGMFLDRELNRPPSQGAKT